MVGNDIYVLCPDYGAYGSILVVDASAGRVARKLALTHFAYPIVVDQGVWTKKGGGPCVESQACVPWVERLDPQTGSVTFHLDQNYVGHTTGYVWTADASGSLSRIDVATLVRTPAQSIEGSIFAGPCADVAGTNSPDVTSVAEVGEQCWGAASDASQGRARFVRFGPGGIDYESPWVAAPRGMPDLMILDGAFWMFARVDDDHDEFVQVDPTTGQTLGTKWSVGDGDLFVAGGKVWHLEVEHDYRLVRLAIGSQSLWSGPAASLPSPTTAAAAS